MSITLDTALGVTDAFATVTEADAYLEVNADWNAASDEAKANALVMARYFLEGEYSCTIEGTIPDALKFANSLLAADYISAPTSFQSSENTKMKRVKAGSVESETEYLGGGAKYPASWPQVMSIMQDLCPKITGLATFITRA